MWCSFIRLEGGKGRYTISHRTTNYASLEASDTLYLYLEVSDVLVSAPLFKEDENWKQRPVFFVSKFLFETETWYTHLEQATLALRVAAKKLHPYS